MEDYILKHSGSEIDAAVDKIKNLDNVGSGADGREVELQTNSTHIQWRYSGESEWRNLIELKRLEGPSGEKGETGQNAINPNFSIGTVTTLDAGSQTTVSLTGTYPNLKLNFGIPRGADGGTQEDIKAAVNDYLEENPVQSGATAEQAAQIQANTNAIGTEELPTTAKTLKGAIAETFQSVSSGKTLIASAITDKGVTTSNDFKPWQIISIDFH